MSLSAPPTWGHLCKCLRENIVGRNDVAMEIERRVYYKSEVALCVCTYYIVMCTGVTAVDSSKPWPAPTGEKRRQEEDTEHTEEEQGEAVGH